MSLLLGVNLPLGPTGSYARSRHLYGGMKMTGSSEPSDPVRTEERVTAATQTKIHFDMLRKRLSILDDNSQS
jgi:hypothetical protein